MVMKKDRRKRDIKSKLVAALCMLMVSCIMVVSSTYAWFTLSTAPEVTGISTAIGGNGNLEMALLPNGTSVSEALSQISGVGASINSQWGNLVDLSTGYGLEKITLNPSTLGTVTDGKLPSHFLSAPTYGADGRVSGMNNTLMDKAFNNGSFNVGGFGVRAVGTSSGMSAHEMEYRNALVAADNAFDAALAAAKNAVSEGGSSLADLAIKKANDKTNGSIYTDTDVQSMVTAYNMVLNTVTKMEEALKLYIIADYLGTTNVTEANFDTVHTTMKGLTLDALISGNYADGITNAAGMVTKLAALRTDVESKITGLGTLNGGSYDWSKLSPYATGLADIDSMELNGNAIADYMNGTADVGALLNGERQLVVNVDKNDSTGIFVEIANFVGTFSTPVVFEKISYGQFNLNNVSVTMIINATADPYYLNVADGAASAPVDGAFNSTSANIDSFYGFIIDMAFRTNAADSSLLLQTDAVDRIYADNTANPATMGGGSTMTYTATQASGYDVDQLKGLMENIRIVLFNPETMAIYGYARLDASEATVTAGENGAFSVTMPIKMWQIGYDANGDGEIDNDEAKMERWAVDAAGKEDATITKLVQNTATAVSSLVYLDGKDLTNADVGNGAITGTMNLQFASSAELKPMEYNDLRKPSDNTTTAPTAPTATTMTSVTTNSADYTATAAFSGNSIALNITGADSNDTVTVTVGSSTYDAVYAEVGGVAGWTVTGVTETLAADTAITVTVTPVANP